LLGEKEQRLNAQRSTLNSEEDWNAAIFRSKLKITQRFNAGQYAFLFVESHRDNREFLSSLAGLDLYFITKPSVKTLGIVKLMPPVRRKNFQL
jgi:hypothetical protein